MTKVTWDGSIQNMPLVLHPELIGAAFKIKEADLYICWVVLKALDACQDNSGHRDANNMLLLFRGLFSVEKSRAYALLEKGTGKYWNDVRGKKGKRTTSLCSYKKVIEHLQPTMIKTAPFSIRFSDLESANIECCGWKYIRSLLISFIAARFPDSRPTAYATVAENTGMTPAAVRRNLANCIHLQKYPNFEIIATDTNYEILRSKMYALINKTRKNCYFIPPMIDKQYCLVRQMPNSYELSEFERASYKKRPRELRQLDKANSLSCSERKYYNNLERYSKKDSTNGVKKYISNGHVDCQEKGVVFMWESVENER